VYVRDVGGSLEIVGMTESFADFDVAQSELLVSWTESGKAPVRLRATSLRRKSYYRFDTVRSPGSSSYRWPTKVLGALGLVRSDLGVIGWTSAELDGNSKAVYLPLAIGVVGQQPTQYSVIVRSDFELSEVYITLSGLNRKEGQPALIDGQALGQGYYPAQRAIRFQIDRPPDPGLYSLEIGVSLSTGGVATTGLIFEQRMTSGDG
jgi:hypothetical protein